MQRKDTALRLHALSSTAWLLCCAGLKLGIYTDSGSKTCAKYSGSLGFEKEDAAQLAEWGVDFLKHDNCFSVPEKEVRRPA